jgi:hypothetical protein
MTCYFISVAHVNDVNKFHDDVIDKTNINQILIGYSTRSANVNQNECQENSVKINIFHCQELNVRHMTHSVNV